MSNKETRIFFYCESIDDKTGGVKHVYRHVDVLNKNGFNAHVLHSEKGFRHSWFRNDTIIAYSNNFGKEINLKTEQAEWVFREAVKHGFYLKRRLSALMSSPAGKLENVELTKKDFLVIPEYFGPNIADVRKGARKVILNQNPFHSFDRYPFDKNDLKCAYLDEDVVATIVCSEHSYEFLRFAFPGFYPFKIRYGFSPKKYCYCEAKKKKIAFMPRKQERDARDLINMLKFRGKLRDFDFVKMDDVHEDEYAKILKEAAIFLSFSKREGLGFPPAEAMACGCVVIGYDGEGGKEFFKEEFCYPVREGDLIGFSEAVESVIDQFERDKAPLLEMGKKASTFILSHYSLEAEEASIVSAWEQILQKCEGVR